MLRQNVGYPEIARIESSPRVALVCESYTEMLNGSSRTQQKARVSAWKHHGRLLKAVSMVGEA
jgi:hypothetical protein